MRVFRRGDQFTLWEREPHQRDRLNLGGNVCVAWIKLKVEMKPSHKVYVSLSPDTPPSFFCFFCLVDKGGVSSSNQAVGVSPFIDSLERLGRTYDTLHSLPYTPGWL